MPWTRLLDNNRSWVADKLREDPTFFSRNAATHKPEFLWIGCSDARVPANVITGTSAGEMFVHRNIANQVHPTDANLSAVVQYAVEVLKVKDIIVCGHADCGGVKAALGGPVPAAVEQWISQVRTIARIHGEELDRIAEPAARVARLVELNVMEQVYSLARNTVVQNAWAGGAPLAIHGVVYDLNDGVLRDVGVTLDGSNQATAARPSARGARTAEPLQRAG